MGGGFSAAQARQLVKELTEERGSQDVGWLALKQIGGGDNQQHVLEGWEHLTVGGKKDERREGRQNQGPQRTLVEMIVSGLVSEAVR